MNFARIARCTSRSTWLPLLLVNVASAQQLWTVDDNAPANFTTIQSAVDAAADGDAILVQPGTYSGFQIAGKSVAVIGDPTLMPTVTSAIAVMQTASGQVVVLARLHQIAPATTGTASGLELSACAGPVRIEDCLFRGQNGTQNGPAGSGVFIVQCPDVVFSAASAFGGTGSASGGRRTPTRGAAVTQSRCSGRVRRSSNPTSSRDCRALATATTTSARLPVATACISTAASCTRRARTWRAAGADVIR